MTVYLTRDAAARSSDKRAKWHWTRVIAGGTRVTACSSLAVDTLEFGMPPSQIAEPNRCRANGCRALWPSGAAQ